MFSLNSNNEFPLSCVVYLLLFSYELHRQLGLKDEARHISVMYAVANCHYLSNALPCMCSFEACLSFSCRILFCYVFFFFKSFSSAADPGVVKSNIMREVPSSLSLLAFTILKLLGLLQSPENGVESILDAALAPPVGLSCSDRSHVFTVNVITKLASLNALVSGSIRSLLLWRKGMDDPLFRAFVQC